MIDAERDHLKFVLDRARWRIEGLAGAAEILGLHPSTLRSKMRKLGIARPRTGETGGAADFRASRHRSTVAHRPRLGPGQPAGVLNEGQNGLTVAPRKQLENNLTPHAWTG